ncbi:MAG: peptide ABC transporter permease [Rhizobiales bacterium 65-79]|jgi:peptide/nickel transport system permease protein|nr:ABC transporter permease [Hyphomicrobiales bacterium]OJU05794.1 MAG: peptide ABC transporter permease [Rhizobiales bacterium 65-79]
MSAKPSKANDKTFRRPGPMLTLVRSFCRSWSARACLAVMSVIVLAAVFAPWIAPQNPYDLAQISMLDAMLPPGSRSMSGMIYWLGTDGQGRDLLSAIIYGLGISLEVGVLTAIFAGIVGITLGLLAAYRGGWVDAAIMRLVDLQFSFPAILVALMLLAFMGKGIGNVVVALVVVEWATYARTARAAALVERSKEYIEAAICLAIPVHRIVYRHLLPNCLPSLIVIATIQIGRAIALEATLSFLGIGVPVTEPSLGLLISNGSNYMLAGKLWVSFWPGVALLVTVVTINLIGDRLRDVLNPRSL